MVGEGRRPRFGQHRHMRVIGMLEADENLSPWLPERGDLLRRKRKPEELHRGGLALWAGVLTGRVGLATDALARDLNEGAVLDPAETRQGGFAALRVVDLEHHRGDQFAALRDQRIVGRQLIGDLRFSALLDVQHLLALLPHRVEILEIEGGERAYFDSAVLFDFTDLAPALAPYVDVLVERQDVGARQLAPVPRLRRIHALLVTGAASPARP